MSALLIAVRLIEDRSRLGSRLAAIAVCPVISAIAFFGFFQVIYGTPNPSVVYGGATRMAVGTIVRGAPGLLFDQQFGLIPNAPVYLCACAGIVVMVWRGPRRLALEILALAVPYYLVATSFPAWWGGTTAPARYAVPIALLLVVPAAVWFATAKSVAARTASISALVVSLFMTATIATVGRGALLFNFRDGMSRVALWLTPVVDLTKALPSMFQNPLPTVLLQTAVWLAAISSAVAVGAVLGRRSHAAMILGLRPDVGGGDDGGGVVGVEEQPRVRRDAVCGGSSGVEAFTIPGRIRLWSPIGRFNDSSPRIFRAGLFWPGPCRR